MTAQRPRGARVLVSTVASFALLACSGADHKDLTSDASAVLVSDSATDPRWGSDAPFDDEPTDAGKADVSDEAGDLDADLGSDMDADLDADVGDGGEIADADAAQTGDAAQPGDAGCADGGCGPSHPLMGHYAVRTQIYARQQATLETDSLDLVSKGVIISTAEIDALGVVNEHYCYLEINNDVGVVSWAAPSTFQRVPDTHVALVQNGGRYVRPLADHHAYLGWSATKTASDCTPGATSATGCHCPENAGLPTRPDDCRVEDTDGDGKPGAILSVDLGAPSDPSVVSTLLALSVVARFNLEWSLPTTATATIEGSLRGGLEQGELGRSGDLAGQFGALLNSVCPNDTSRVELVRGDFTCASLLAKRPVDAATFGTFNVDLDAPVPDVSACPNPACSVDTDNDGTPDCNDTCPKDAHKTAAGVCGCGVADTNTDGDSLPDCTDLCISDPAKIVPGACGCGTADTDTDHDSNPDCTDQCASDPAKILPGACGCGVADTNSDSDAQPDCHESCIHDPLKLAPGTCGCGVADTDSDNDGTPNCNDACPDDPHKNFLGLCGCGVADTNADGDSQPACTDQCDNDPLKLAPGACGCGTADTDTDHDGTADCKDSCAQDPAKTAPGACGCGVADTNSDGDSQPDCKDQCAQDALKLTPGACGCGVADTNSDGDSQPDCIDQCDADPRKVLPGQCGCGVADADLNGDGIIDCVDACPADPAKVAPGLCGCGVADTNTDGDSQPDCRDSCPTDPAKLAAGQCGCGVADTDSDGDGVANCNDACPNDRLKAVLGVCGCGVVDSDSDSDGRPDCVDGCPADSTKIAAGVCGCGVADTDSDGDGTANCRDACPADAAKIAVGVCGCGVADTDTDRDGTADCNETCDSDPLKLAPGTCGCGTPDTDADGDGKPACVDQCDNNPALTVPGRCGCTACAPNPLAGRYAMRSSVFSKQRNGNTVTTSKGLNYSLVDIAEAADGSLTLTERTCWTQTLPNTAEGGLAAYSWSAPANVQAMPLLVQPLVANANGTYLRTIPTSHLGWDPARQPAACSATSTPVSGWNTAWGNTCACTPPASAMPPYHKTTGNYDCRLTDPDADGLPGVTAFASTTAPTPDSKPTGITSATAYGAADSGGSWTITPGANGRHSATITDNGVASVVGCSGTACAFLASTPAQSKSCPEALNKAQLVRSTDAYDSCAEIINLRDSASLFVQTQDGDFPSTAVCPAP